MIDWYIDSFAHELATAEPVRSKADLLRRVSEALRQVGKESNEPGHFSLSPKWVSHAEVEDASYEDTYAIQITFYLRAQQTLLSEVTSNSQEWIPDPRLPDSGNASLSRGWFDLPSDLTMVCTAIVDESEPPEIEDDTLTCTISKS